jgi:hypothetical protein
MSVSGKITVDVEAKAAGFTKGLAAAGKDAQRWAKGMEADFKAITFGKGFSAEGVAAFGRSLNAGAQEAKAFATKLREGESVAQAFGQLVNGIPIVGTFKQAGEAIRELVTGEQAARVELDRLNDHLVKVTHGYRDIANADSIRGLFGDAREHRQLEIQRDNDVRAFDDTIRDLNRKREDFLDENASTVGRAFGFTMLLPEQQKHLKAIDEDLALAVAGRRSKMADGDFAIAEQEKSALHAREIYLRDSALKVDAIEAQMAEVRMRRSGDALGSARKRIEEEAHQQEALIRNEAAELARPFLKSADTFKAQGDVKKEAEQRKLAADLIADADRRAIAVERFKDQTIQSLTEDQGLRKFNAEAEAQEKLLELQEEGKIQSLKIQDEQINAENERRGVAIRSHLAEAEQAAADEARAVYNAKQAFMDSHEGRLDLNDPTLKGEIQAAAVERQMKQDGLRQKAQDETLSNQQRIAEETRKAWEQTEEPTARYLAKLQEINHQFERLHDSRLRDQQIKDLDAKTLGDLEKRDPDHRPDVNLYGRTLGTQFLTAGNGNREAQEQLEAMKKAANFQEQWDNQVMRPLAQWLNKVLGNSGAEQYIDIPGV